MSHANTLESILSFKRIDENGCWIYRGSINIHGYGCANLDGKLQTVHRLSAHKYLGLDLDKADDFALHKPLICKSRKCFNPEHLYIGNHADNMGDKKKAHTHCSKGHELTNKNTMRGSRGEKVCRICDRTRCRKAYKLKKNKLKEI
jgi:hypothetical protein